MNECNDVESLIDMEIEFQMWGAAKEKARLPIERFVRGVLSNFKMNWRNSSIEKLIQKFCFQFHLVRKN